MEHHTNFIVGCERNYTSCSLQAEQLSINTHRFVVQSDRVCFADPVVIIKIDLLASRTCVETERHGHRRAAAMEWL